MRMHNPKVLHYQQKQGAGIVAEPEKRNSVFDEDGIEYVSYDLAMEITGMTDRAIQNGVKRGDFRAIKIGGTTMIHRGDAETHVKRTHKNS